MVPVSSSKPELPKAAAVPAISISAAAGWVETDENVEEGQCYKIVPTGAWVDSDGVKCGPAGACPEQLLKLLGPQDITDAQKKQFFFGQHPRGALICRIGDRKWDFYVPGECQFLAPFSGRLSFRMNDDDRGNPAVKSGACGVTISRIEPQWVRPDGSITIIARIATTDWLHLTPKGPYWEWDGEWSPVGMQEGVYPTVINGIYWWPHWRSRERRTDPAPIPALWPVQPGRVHIAGVQAKRVAADISHVDNDDVVIRFHKTQGLGASQIICVVGTK